MFPLPSAQPDFGTVLQNAVVRTELFSAPEAEKPRLVRSVMTTAAISTLREPVGILNCGTSGVAISITTVSTQTETLEDRSSATGIYRRSKFASANVYSVPLLPSSDCRQGFSAVRQKRQSESCLSGSSEAVHRTTRPGTPVLARGGPRDRACSSEETDGTGMAYCCLHKRFHVLDAIPCAARCRTGCRTIKEEADRPRWPGHRWQTRCRFGAFHSTVAVSQLFCDGDCHNSGNVQSASTTHRIAMIHDLYKFVLRFGTVKTYCVNSVTLLMRYFEIISTEVRR